MELEQQDGYLVAGAKHKGDAESADLVDRLIREESYRSSARSSQVNNGPRPTNR